MAFNPIKGNAFVLTTGGWWITANSGLLTAGSAGTQIYNLAISNIGLYAADTTGELELMYQSDTATAVFHLRGMQGGGYADIHFATPHKVSERIFIKTLTAGTGYIYCS